MRSIDGLTVTRVAPEHAEPLAELERICFPTALPEQRLSAEGVLEQCERFPDGGFVILDGERVIGMGLGCFVDYDIEHPQHRLDEVVGELGSDLHDPHGTWYYGTDIAVHPDYQGRGIGRLLYDLRKDLARRYNRAGIIAGGVIPGFAEHKHDMTADEYIARVVTGELHDPTLSFQLANDFEARGAIAGYWGDPAVDNWASFIVWHNPDFDPDRLAAEKSDAATPTDGDTP